VRALASKIATRFYFRNAKILFIYHKRANSCYKTYLVRVTLDFMHILCIKIHLSSVTLLHDKFRNEISFFYLFSVIRKAYMGKG
jgi:hypothetical protein